MGLWNISQPLYNIMVKKTMYNTWFSANYMIMYFGYDTLQFTGLYAINFRMLHYESLLKLQGETSDEMR